MKTCNAFKGITITAFGLILMHAGTVAADQQLGSFTTGLAAAVDFYQVTCFDDGNGVPAYLEARVKDSTANTAKVAILIQKGTSCTTNKCAQFSFDTTDSDTNYSPVVKVTQGTGVYNMFVMHSAAGSDSYTAEPHCKTAGGIHTGTSIVSKQQQ